MFTQRRGILVTGFSLIIALTSWHSAAKNTASAKPGTGQTLFFSIPGQNLSDALIQFASQAQLNLIASSDILRHRFSSPVIGTLKPEAALRQLLSRTQLSYELDEETSSLRITAGVPLDNSVKSIPKTSANSEDVEEVYVVMHPPRLHRGISKAREIKQHSRGVVEAVAARAVGEYPEVNVAESLQRVVGVSIDRQNNEGRTITVRGLAPDFNLITYNGRQIPGVNTRSFDFGLLTAENISHVEIYKTGRADVPSGGVGSTINISTHEPFKLPSQTFIVEAKALSDTSVKESKNVTPELSGLWSMHSNDKTFGILISGSYQERRSQLEEASIPSWSDGTTDAERRDAIEQDENLSIDNLYPSGQSFAVRQHHRSKTNGQVVLQYSLNRKLSTSINYNYTKIENQLNSDTLELTYPNFNSEFSEAVGSADINENGVAVYVSSPEQLLYFENQYQNITNEAKSFGIRMDYLANDALALSIDAHRSTAGSSPEDSDIDLSARMVIRSVPTTFDARNVDIPTVNVEPPDNQEGFPYPTPSTSSSIFNKDDTAITQIQSKLQWQNMGESFRELNSIDFGLGYTKVFNRGRITGSFLTLRSQSYDDLIEPDYGNGILNELSGGLGDNDFFFTYDIERIIESSAEIFDENFIQKPDSYNTDHQIIERTTSAYIQFNFGSGISNMTIDTRAGVRYERTIVDANSLSDRPASLKWDGPTSYYLQFDEELAFTSQSHNYDIFLPNLDIGLNISDGLRTRLSASRTLTRPDLSSMQAFTDLASPGFSGRNEFDTSQGNPQLAPHVSKNMDVSIEWYYQENSYLAAGYFYKDVENFAFDRIVYRPIFDLRDPYSGQRAEAVRQDLRDQNIPVTDEEVWAQLIINQDNAFEVSASEDDPLLLWRVAEPVNTKKVNIYGWEFTLQHVFGTSGFGSIVNLTLVDSSTTFDRALAGLQFARPGVSDSANIIGYYDKGSAQVRLAYHWRDEFLSSVSDSGAIQPRHTEAYDQLDLRVSYDVTDQLSVLFEALNVLGSTQRDYGRYSEQFIFASAFKPRYSLGFRYSF